MDEELMKALKDLGVEIKTSTEEQIKPLITRLAALEESGTEPDDTKVKDLEKRLDDAEIERKKLQDDLRLLQANPAVPDGGQSRGAGTMPDFKGWFITDLDKTRTAIRALRQGETRALDSSLFVGDAGKVSIETADAFIDTIVKETVTLSRITTRRMGGPKGSLDELRSTERTIRAAVEGVAPDVADSITVVRRELETVEVILAEDITLTFLEDNIEKAGAEASIAAILGKKFGSQLNDLHINGDDTTGNFLSINKGIVVLAKADGDVSTTLLSSETKAKGCLNNVLRTIPNRFRATVGLEFTVPTGFAQTYADEFADRETSAGDQVFVAGFPNLRYFGIPVIPEPHFHEATSGIETDDMILLCPSSNQVHGIQRAFTVDAQWQPRKRVVEYTLTARVDAQYATGEPIVYGTAVPSGLL